MNSANPNLDYLKVAEKLTDEQTESLLCRMRNKTTKRYEREKFVSIEDFALQLEAEDADLADWRKVMIQIKNK